MSECPNCLSCNKKFTLPKPDCPNRLPVLLGCGHTYCRHCVAKWACKNRHVSCPTCGRVTAAVERNAKNLWPNFYIAGILGSMQTIPSFSCKFLGFKQLTSNRQKKNIPKINRKCSECINAVASGRCTQCQVDMCGRCFGLIHNNSRLMRQHHSIPLRPSLTHTECDKHQRLLEFYCECDRCPVCPECLLTPDHETHKIVRMIDKYGSMEDDLKAAHGQARSALAHAEHVKTTLSLEWENAQFDAYRIADHVHQSFQNCVGILQARFLGLLREVESCAQSSCDEIQSLISEIETQEQLIRDAYEDTELILSPDTKRQVVTDPERLLRVLSSSKCLPYKLETAVVEEKYDSDEEDQEERANTRYGFSEDPEIYFSLERFGEITVKEKTTYKLVTLEECPGLLDIPVQPSPVKEKVEKEIKISESLPRQIREPPSKDQELVRVTTVLSPTNFYVQRLVDKQHLQAIEQSLKVYGKRKPMVDEVLSRLSVGDTCAAVYRPTRKWYRARVTNLVKTQISDDTQQNGGAEAESPLSEQTAGPKDVVELTYVDYGNATKAEVSCLRRLPDSVRSIPELAVQCCLNNICPADAGYWKPEIISVFAKMIGNRPLLMTTVRRDGGCRMVDLHKPAADEIDADVPTSVRDALLFLDMAKLNITGLLPTPSAKPSRKYLTPSVISISSILDPSTVRVSVSDLQSLNKFSVQLMDSHMDSLVQMTKDLQDWVSKELGPRSMRRYSSSFHPLQILCPYAGMVCVAKYPFDDIWYRATVIEVLDDQQVKVLYVDYGNEMVVHFSHLLRIPDQFMVLPTQAISCALDAVSPLQNELDFSERCLKRFYELLNPHPVLMEVRGIKDGVYLVELFDYTDEDPSVLSISDRLYREGFILRPGRSGDEESAREQVTELVSPTPIVNGDAIFDEGHTITPEPNDETQTNKIKVRVTEAVSPDLFYVLTKMQTVALNEMMCRLQSDVEQEMSLAGTDEGVVWEEGDRCVVRSKMEGKRWCRGVVSKMTLQGEALDPNDHNCSVRLLDYGWEEHTDVAQLRKLPDEYTEEEPYLTKCRLEAVRPAGGSANWTSTATRLFQELVRGEECLMTVLEVVGSETDVLAVELFIFKDGAAGGDAPIGSTGGYVKVSSLLELEGMALPVRKVTVKDKDRFQNILGPCFSASDRFPPAEPTSQRKEVADENNNRKNDEDASSGGSASGDVSDNAEAKSNAGIVEVCDNVDTHGSGCLTARNRNVRGYASAAPLPLSESVYCTVCHIENQHIFFMHRAPEVLDVSDPIFKSFMEWRETMDQIQDPACSVLAVVDEKDVIVGEPCLCRCIEDGLWHRALICSSDPHQGLVCVRYVDFGRLDSVATDTLRRIPDSLLEIPIQAYLCHLVDSPNATDLSSEIRVVSEFTKQVEGKRLVATICARNEEGAGGEGAGPLGRSHLAELYCCEEDGSTVRLIDRLAEACAKPLESCV